MKPNYSIVRQIVRLLMVDKLGNREICRKLSVASSTVSKYQKFTDVCEFTFDELNALDDVHFSDALKKRQSITYLQPDFEAIEEIKRSHKKMTLEKAFDLGYFNQKLDPGVKFYSQAHLYDLFDEWYMDHFGQPKMSRVPCNPGDRLEIDFVGDSLHWIDGEGKRHEAKVFAAAYRYSGLIYAEAFEDMTKPAWLTGVVHTLEAHGVPRTIGFDNDKSLVKVPDSYIAELTSAMRELCDYYGMFPCSCKIKRPKEKNVVENSCGIIEFSYADLEGFTGEMYAKDLDDVNLKLKNQVNKINETPFTKNDKGSRLLNFDRYEKPQLKQCPLIPYEVCEWKIVRVDKNGWAKIGDNKRYLVHYLQRRKDVVCKISSTKIRFYSKDSHEDCGSYDRPYTHEYQSFFKPELYSPVERALTKGFEETLHEFENIGYALPNIVGYLRAVFNNEQSVHISNYKQVMGIKGLCEAHGVKLVDSCCEQAAKIEQTANYDLIKSFVIDTIRKINAQKKEKNAQAQTQEPTAQKQKSGKKMKNSSNEGVKLRGAADFAGGSQHE